MLTLKVYRYARLLTYYFAVTESAPDAWLCAHADGEGQVFKVYAVSPERVPDLGTMVREYSREALPELAQDSITERLGGQFWRILKPESFEAKGATATLCLFNTAYPGTHSSYPYASSTDAIADARAFTRESADTVAQVLTRTILNRGDGGSTRVWTISGGVCKDSVDLWDAGGVLGMMPDTRRKRGK